MNDWNAWLAPSVGNGAAPAPIGLHFPPEVIARIQRERRVRKAKNIGLGGAIVLALGVAAKLAGLW